MNAGGVVLAGGRSTRMGAAKAGLEWHGATLLHRAAATVRRAVTGPVVVVAAPGQDLPDLPAGVTVALDPVEGLGPMQGLAGGLAVLADRVEAAFVCATDVPFLHPAYVRRVLAALTAESDVVLPVANGFRQPLAAAYRTRIAGLVADLLARGDDRPGMLYEHCAVTRLDEAALLADPTLARHDPELDSVLNVNTPADYRAARDREPPMVTVDWRGTHTVRAATVGEAAGALGLTLDDLTATIDGAPAPPDGGWPVFAGDTITFRPAAWGRTSGAAG